MLKANYEMVPDLITDIQTEIMANIMFNNEVSEAA
jgi:hypothetical protein